MPGTFQSHERPTNVAHGGRKGRWFLRNAGGPLARHHATPTCDTGQPAPPSKFNSLVLHHRRICSIVLLQASLPHLLWPWPTQCSIKWCSLMATRPCASRTRDSALPLAFSYHRGFAERTLSSSWSNLLSPAGVRRGTREDQARNVAPAWWLRSSFYDGNPLGCEPPPSLPICSRAGSESTAAAASTRRSC